MKLLDTLCVKKEDEHEEGGDLLLDTEIWDLVLLESGDVEINPGPLTSRLMSVHAQCTVKKRLFMSNHVHVDDQLEKVVDDILGKNFTILKLICISYMHGAYYNLGEDVCFQVFTSVYSVRANWHDVCLALGLPPSLLSAIRTNHPDDVKACLREGLSNWLQRNYNTKLHGFPS